MIYGNKNDAITRSLQYLDDHACHIQDALHRAFCYQSEREPGLHLFYKYQEEATYRVVGALRAALEQQDTTPLVEAFYGLSKEAECGLDEDVSVSTILRICSQVRRGLRWGLKPYVVQHPVEGVEILDTMEDLLDRVPQHYVAKFEKKQDRKKENALAHGENEWYEGPGNEILHHLTCQISEFDLFKGMFEAIPDDGVVVFCLNDATVTYMNPAGRRMVQYDHSVVGISVFTFIAPSSEKLFQQSIDHALHHGHCQEDLVYQRQDATTFLGQMSLFPIYDMKTQAMFLGMRFRDNTRHIEMQKALQKSRNLLRAFFDNWPASIYVKDIQGSYIVVNRHLAESVAVEPSQMIGRKASVFFPKDLVRKWDEIERQVFLTGQLYQSEGPSPFDSKITHLTSTFPLYDEYGNLYAVGSIITDITERKKVEEALRESEERYRHLVEISPDMIAVHSDGKLVFVNNAGVKMLGASDSQELIGRSIFDFVAPRCREMVQDRTRQLLEQGINGVLIEETLLRQDGTEVDVEVVSSSFMYKGRPSVQVIARDITDRKEALAALRISEERYERAVKSAGVGVWDWDLQTGEIYLAPNLKALLGYSDDEIPNQIEEWAKYVYPEDAERVMDAAERHIKRETPLYMIEHRMMHKDGSHRWISVRGTVICDEDGKPVRLSGTDTDITDRKKAEEALLESEQKFRSIVQQSSDGIFLTNEQGVLIEWNHGAEQITGLKREDVIGQLYWDVLFWLVPDEYKTPDAYDHYRFGMQEFLKTGEAMWLDQLMEQEFQRYGSLNERFFAQQRSFAIRTQQGFMGGAIIRDITRIKHVEEELKRASEAAEAATQAKSQFLANMSHEIRTPLNAVIGMTKLLLHTELTPKQRDFVETAHTSGNALLSLINDILDFSKIESGHLELEQYPFDLRMCVEESLDLVAARASDKYLDLAYFIDEDVPQMLVGDMSRLRQILMNLLSNAVKFTDKGEVVLSVTARQFQTPGFSTQQKAEEDGRLVMSPQEHDGRAIELYELQFSVRDTGIGISKEGIARIFQSFSQVHPLNMRKKYGGTGLGLAISKLLVEMMGGKMGVESQLSVGSTFSFTMLAEATSARQQGFEELYLPPYLHSNQETLEGKRVLIVDDSATSRHVLTQWMQLWGMRTWVVGSDLEALRFIRQGEHFDVAILDLLLPEINSLTLAAAVRSNPQTNALPLIIFISAGLGVKAAQSSGIEKAVFQTKPIKPAPLHKALINIFSGHVSSVVEHLSGLDQVSSLVPQPMMPRLTVPLTILLADDTAANQKVALYFLEHIGYSAESVKNGIEVIEKLKTQWYDVIFMDVEMPELGGIETTKYIRSHWPEDCQPWIIAMTAHAMGGDRERFLQAGMNDYISKPVRIEDLATVLMRVKHVDVPVHGQYTGIEQEPGCHPQPVMPGSRLPEKREMVHDVLPMEGVVEHPVINPEMPLQNIPEGINPEMLDKFLKPLKDGSSKIMREIVTIFINDMSQRLASIHQAIERKQSNDLKLFAHSLKSLSAQVGAVKLSNISYQLEQMGGEGEFEGAGDLATLATSEFEQARRALEEQIQDVL